MLEHSTQTAVMPKAKTGMWLFILTEVMLFGGLFLVYAAYRYRSPAAFHEASLELDLALGTLNTAVLLTSSLFVALSVLFKERERSGPARLFLAAAIALGFVFLGVKAVEWSEKFRHGLYPGAPQLLEQPHAAILYYGLYFTMTGLHALHVLVGIGVLGVVLARMGRNAASVRLSILDNAGLYWHLVDIIWIFLFPLFYLIH